MDTDKVLLAKALAGFMHDGQVDRGGNPYIGHPAAVAEMVSGESDKIVAWLHDVVEDTAFPLSEIRSMFGDEVGDAVDAVTHRKGESYDDYIDRLSQNEIARRVKIADLTHNSDLSRIPEPKDADFERVKKYAKYRERLLAMN